MKENLILPLVCHESQVDLYKADSELSLKVCSWLNTRAEFIREVWSKHSTKQEIDFSKNSIEIADEIIKVLTSRVFCYQSKRNLIKIISEVRQNLVRQINNSSTIKFFLLYNGGYRVSPISNKRSLIFEPDQTELMLLYQIALLKNKILALYGHGIEFNIVINNGVAKWVNDISTTDTENYVGQLRKMIAFFGAEKNVNIILQSELDCFNQGFTFETFQTETLLSKENHLLVERFLGRRCSEDEAKYRFALYNLAEKKWEEDLSPIIASQDGIIMRQVAHPDMLSFRPFPGGAIRIQNGTFGFHYHKNVLTSKLITSKSLNEFDILWVPYDLPWKNHMKNKNFDVKGLNNV